MDVVSSNSPYILNIGSRDGNGNQLGEYKIYRNSIADSNLIYAGKVYSAEGHAIAVPVNLQPIFVNYTPSAVGKIDNYGNALSISGTGYLNQKFEMTYPTTAGTTNTLSLNMLYCAENATNHELGWDSSTSAFPMCGNDFIQRKFYNGSYLSFGMLFSENSTNTVSASLITNGSTSISLGSPNKESKRWSGTYTFDTSVKSFHLRVGEKNVTPEIEVVNCLPANSYILYYVNSFGAIDYIICDKNNSVTYNADRHSMTKYATIHDRTAFGKVNYINNTTRTWTINTDIMSDEQSKHMYKVFNSEYMWLFDVDKNELNSVVMEDANLKIKRFDTDKIYNYTIKVAESQTFTIQ